MKTVKIILVALILLAPLAGFPAISSASASTLFPTISIVSIVPDTSVTIQTYNLPANDTYTVLMNYMHTQGIGGIQVGTLVSGAGGSQTFTYSIPATLKGQYQIAIRIQSPTSGFFAYNWFYNNSSGVVSPPQPTPYPAGYSGYPTFSIVSVVPDTSVTIQTYNLRANDTYNVLMNYMHTKGVGGILVATQASGAGGSQTFTYSIPATLKGQYQIAIRLESPTSGYFAYNWFYNSSSAVITPAPTPVPGTDGYSGFPTISIVSVVRDTSVTIQTYNLRANDTYNVLMNYMHTQGSGGIVVATQASGSGGSQTFTYSIPAALKGQHQIAIRLQSPTSGYFAYNWFYNGTYP